jgi:hypothetical protein
MNENARAVNGMRRMLTLMGRDLKMADYEADSQTTKDPSYMKVWPTKKGGLSHVVWCKKFGEQANKLASEIIPLEIIH